MNDAEAILSTSSPIASPPAAAFIMQNDEIKQFLPHRYPFLLVDRVIEFTPGLHIKAIKNVSCNEPFFQGHFPHYAVMPTEEYAARQIAWNLPTK